MAKWLGINCRICKFVGVGYVIAIYFLGRVSAHTTNTRDAYFASNLVDYYSAEVLPSFFDMAALFQVQECS